MPVAMCLANTDGSDGRARTNEWGKITHLMPTQQLSPGIAARSAGGIPSPVDPSRINKGMIPTGDVLTRLLLLGAGEGTQLTGLEAKRSRDARPIPLSAGPGGYDGLSRPSVAPNHSRFMSLV